MGYYSDVVIAVNKETKLKYGLLLQKLKVLDNLADNSWVTSLGNTYWMFESLKWYERFDDVIAITALMDEFDDDTDKGIGYGFMCMGEETGDIEERGECIDFDIYQQQSIGYPTS